MWRRLAKRHLRGKGNTVAVWTTIADRPRPDPYERVNAYGSYEGFRGAEACIGIGVQNMEWRNPPVEDWGKTFPARDVDLQSFVGDTARPRAFQSGVNADIHDFDMGQ